MTLRGRRLAKPAVALVAAVAVAIAISGCAYLKPGSLAVSQPQAVGSAHVHFVLCTVGGEAVCGPATEAGTIQYVLGIAVPEGSAPPATITATPVGGGASVAFTRNDEVASELAAAAAVTQKFLSQFTPKTPKEVEELKQIQSVFGGAWPPPGMQAVGYLSTPVQEVKGSSVEWSVDADFGLPVPAGGAPFAGPFAAAVAFGDRLVDPEFPASRPVHCLRLEEGGSSPAKGDAFCGGSVQQVEVGTSDLRIATPKKAAQAFVGGSAEVAFPLRFASTAASVPTFSLSATTTAKGGKTKLGAKKFTPRTPSSSTHLSPTGTGKVTVSVPRGIKPGTYQVTLTAQTPQGGTATGVAKLKVVKPKLKLGAVKLDPAKGTAALRVKVPGAGRLTVAGKGVAKLRKKTKKARTLKVSIAPTGAAGALLERTGSAKVRAKITFKPTSGISVSKTKSVVLELR